MLFLEQNGLRVSILDPVEDQARQGCRYCVGGYVWQVEDKTKGPLLTGPWHPDPNPHPFHGQGLPEAFEIALGQHRARVGEDVYVIGVGRVKRESPIEPFHVRNNFTVAEFAAWKVGVEPDTVTMVSEQSFQEWSLHLTRTVRLRGRVLESATLIRNTGSAELPIRWFAHPFFPPGELECFAFSRPCAFPAWVPDAGGFRWNERGFVERKADYDWTKGCFQLVMAPFGYPLDVSVRHPLLGEIKAECRFPVAWLPIWGNDRTISFEPYHHTVVLPGGNSEWLIRYGF